MELKFHLVLKLEQFLDGLRSDLTIGLQEKSVKLLAHIIAASRDIFSVLKTVNKKLLSLLYNNIFAGIICNVGIGVNVRCIVISK